MKMTQIEEQACLANIQSYLDRIHWLENGGDPSKGPGKVCELCEVFERFECIPRKDCRNCPLGPDDGQCGIEKYYIDAYFDYEGLNWGNATVNDLKIAMNAIIKKYKSAGLDISITEV